MELADSRQESARDRWVQQQMEKAMKHLPTDLEVVPSPLLLEEMELAPAGPGSGRGAVDLFTFLSWEAEKTLRHSAGLSVLQSAFDGSRLVIPCPGTGPLRRRSLPAPLASHSGPALKPSPSSRRKKRRRGAPSCSAGEEVVSLPGDVRAAASKPASSPATAPSPRLTAAPSMPSSLTPSRRSEATPEELEERLSFFARQIKTFRKTSLMYSSPELMERIRQMEEDYGTAVRQFYCRPPPSTPGLQGAGAAAEQSTPGLQGAAAAAEQSTPGFQGAAAEQSTPGLQLAVELSEGPEGELPPLPEMRVRQAPLRPLRVRQVPLRPLRVRQAPLWPLRVRQAPLLPLRVRQAPLLPLRVRQAFAVARLNSVPARDDLLVARLNSVPVSTKAAV
ncbi:hypothetical protein CRENBAI_006492 [Crenichthys baileyi]|uniref:Uncharacterized protein n=1 Tax=Crenichthys baileyi TaxID=28760 RepID=A0AAV9QWS4_9TELE